MQGFEIKKPSQVWALHFSLWKKHRSRAQSCTSFEGYFKRLIRGEILLIRNRFQVQSVGLYRNGMPRVMAQLFIPLPNQESWTVKPSLGAVALAENIERDEVDQFWDEFRTRFSGLQVVGPMCGHPYLGISLPKSGSISGFLTSAAHPTEELFFDRFPLQRKFYGFETKLDFETADRLRQKTGSLPRGFKIRQSTWRTHGADFDIMNQLVNASFAEHYDFAPMTNDESWDLFRFMAPILDRNSLHFLYHEDRPIGFTLGVRDYNQVLRNGSDLRNFGRLLTARPNRARLIYTSLLPQFHGQGLIKQIRNRQLINWYKDGIDTVESSYVDEENVKSQRNVGSTGGRRISEFSIWRVC